MGQKERIYQALRKGRTLTPHDALKEFGCFRLGARIFELRREIPPGWEIKTDTPDEGPRYAKYSLIKPPPKKPTILFA